MLCQRCHCFVSGWRTWKLQVPTLNVGWQAQKGMKHGTKKNQKQFEVDHDEYPTSMMHFPGIFFELEIWRFKASKRLVVSWRGTSDFGDVLTDIAVSWLRRFDKTRWG